MSALACAVRILPLKLVKHRVKCVQSVQTHSLVANSGVRYYVTWLCRSRVNTHQVPSCGRLARVCGGLVAGVRNVQTSAYVCAKQDYYEVLGIPKNASKTDVKKAYYRLAKTWHPDTNKAPDASKRFQEVSEAYEVLSDSDQRQNYDTYGMRGPSMGGGPSTGRQGAHGFQDFHGTIDPEELFRSIFGQAGFKSNFEFTDFADSGFGFAPASESFLNLTFHEAARGVNKDMSVNIKDTCPKCRGSKSELGTRPEPCPQCNGSGMETVSTGLFMMRSTCRKCQGSRVFIRHPCTECHGKGKMVMRKTVTVPVPAGVEDGQTVRLNVDTNELFVTFKVASSDYFQRDGADIHTDANISIAQAALGGSVKVKGIYDSIQVEIPRGTSSHTRIRFPGKGIKRVHSYGFGDHYVNLKVIVPKQLSTPQMDLLTAFAELDTETVGTVTGVLRKGTTSASENPKAPDEVIEQTENTGFFGKMKKFFTS